MIKEIKICPKCRSAKVNIDKSNPLHPSLGLPARYICENCGYSSYTFPEMKISDAKKLVQKNIKVKSEPDITYGRFQAKVLWKILAPITLLSGIIELLSKDLLAGIITIPIGIFMAYIAFFRKRFKK